MAFLLSALLVCLGVSARSSREGQTYAAYLQMPLFVLALGAGYLSVDASPAYYLVPLLGTNLVQRAYLLGQGGHQPRHRVRQRHRAPRGHPGGGGEPALLPGVDPLPGLTSPSPGGRPTHRHRSGHRPTTVRHGRSRPDRWIPGPDEAP